MRSPSASVFAGHLPGIHLAHDAAAPPGRIDDAEAQRIDAGLDDDAAQEVERLVAAGARPVRACASRE